MTPSLSDRADLIVLRHPIVHDKYTQAAQQMFDVPHAEESVTVIQNELTMPTSDWNIGLIHGPSGAGKSTLLRQFGNPKTFAWDAQKSVISHFDNVSPEEAAALLSSVGFSTVPAWLRPYHCLSVGERFRCDLARAVASDDTIILVDEFTSVVDRNVARSACVALSKLIRKTGKKIILASCHSDIIPWLCPDWSYDPSEAVTHEYARGSLQRPDVHLKVFRTKYEAWHLFSKYHYLSGDLNKAARCFMATWNDVPVAFCAILAMPNPYKKNCWRASRTVVLPDYQGLGIGVKLSDYMGSLVKAGGGVYYSKTIHPALIAHRLKSGKWKETSHSRQARNPSNESMQKRNWFVSPRFCYAFEYTGEPATEGADNIFWQKC
jgi:hypothetical protein